MRQQEAIEQIKTCEDQIVDSYDQLITCAKVLGQEGYQAAENAKTDAVKGISEKKIKILLFSLFTIPISIILMAVSLYIGILCICLDLGIAFVLLMSVLEEEDKIERSAHQELTKVDSQFVNFNRILDNNQKI